jgi:hypothetical protein
MSTGFWDLLFYPDTFFKNIAQEKVNLIPPVIIVAGGCAISLSGVIVPFGINIIHNQVSDNPLPLIYFGLIPFVWALVRCYVLWPFLGWVLVSGALYLISRLFSKVGSFFATLQNVGYGLVPWVIFTAASVVARSLLVIMPEDHTNILLNPGTVSPLLLYMIVNVLLFILFMLWCCWLWIYAIKHTCRIPVQRATVVVVLAVMVIVSAFYLVTNFPIAV